MCHIPPTMTLPLSSSLPLPPLPVRLGIYQIFLLLFFLPPPFTPTLQGGECFWPVLCKCWPCSPPLLSSNLLSAVLYSCMTLYDALSMTDNMCRCCVTTYPQHFDLTQPFPCFSYPYSTCLPSFFSSIFINRYIRETAASVRLIKIDGESRNKTMRSAWSLTLFWTLKAPQIYR